MNSNIDIYTIGNDSSPELYLALIDIALRDNCTGLLVLRPMAASPGAMRIWDERLFPAGIRTAHGLRRQRN